MTVLIKAIVSFLGIEKTRGRKVKELASAMV